jgi:hypothetical protein
LPRSRFRRASSPTAVDCAPSFVPHWEWDYSSINWPSETSGVALELNQRAETDEARLEVVGQLEQELQRTKDQLRITIEQYETSTEE